MANQNLRDAAARAVELLKATRQFIIQNPVAEYMVHYDEADCDGYCLATDCDIAADMLESALKKEVPSAEPQAR